MRHSSVPVALVLVCTGVLLTRPSAQTEPRRWLAGDTHVHSQWSPGYDRTTRPPTPLIGDDAPYATPKNAAMADTHGLRWMVTTDHGGPNHAALNRDRAYPELQQSRVALPDLLQYYGMELNMPGMDHHTLVIPHGEDERDMLYELERRFDEDDTWPVDPARATAEARAALLAYVAALPRPPLILANHPSRTAKGEASAVLLRDNHGRAPEVYRGMEGAPGHQAAGLARDGSPRRRRNGKPTGFRGDYARSNGHTLGGFDQMTATIGGVWDALLGEGRHFWIVAASDSHVHHADPTREGDDFWPGEFHKTYVLAQSTYDDVLDGLRQGRVFVVAGDLISELAVTVREGRAMAAIGGTLSARPGEPVQVTIQFRDPAGPNHGGRTPRVQRVDVIVGEVSGPGGPDVDRNRSTRVVARLTDRQWTCQGETCTASLKIPAAGYSQYVRVRGTSSNDEEPGMDTPGENPWDDLWFYANPVFIDRGVLAPRE